MVNRCSNRNPQYWLYYGARGITVCERWRQSFVNFLADVGPRPDGPRWSLDRINNDGNYEPGNVRWATPKEQAANRRWPRKRGPKHLWPSQAETSSSRNSLLQT